MWEPPEYPGPCFDLHFDRFDGFIFEAKNPSKTHAPQGRGATISSATCSRRTPKCSQLMLALNTYSFQTIKLKLAAFLPSAAPTGEAPCGAHVFEGFFGLENGPVKSDKSQEKTLFGKEMPEDASRHPKPTSYPQTR